LTAIIDGADVLENRVDGLENTTFQFLELAKFDGIIDAVVLHVVRIARWFESSCSGHRVTVHVRESTIASDVVEIHRSFYNEIENEKEFWLFSFLPWKLLFRATKEIYGAFQQFSSFNGINRENLFVGRNTFGGEKSAPDGTFSFFFLSLFKVLSWLRMSFQNRTKRCFGRVNNRQQGLFKFAAL
jgi:hypothetical protein